MRHFPRPLRLGLSLALVLAGCSDQATSPVAPKLPADGPNFWPEGSPPARTTVCKEGSPGTFTFDIISEGAGTVLVTNPFTLQAGECVEIYEGGDRVEGLRVTEIDLPEGYTIESIKVEDLESGLECAKYCGIFTDTNSRNVEVWKERGFVFTFTNRGPPEPSLSISKTASAAEVEAGQEIGFDITVESGGPGTATGVTLTDDLPTGDGIAWSVDSGDCVIAGNTLTCDFGDLAAGESRTIHLSSPTTAESCGVYANVAEVEATNHNPVSDDATVEVKCAAEPPKLRIKKVADDHVVWTYKPMGFTITVYSDGPGTATGVTLTDPLPTGNGVEWKIYPANSDCVITGNTLTCDFGDLGPGEKRSVHVKSHTSIKSCGLYYNKASAEATNHPRVEDHAKILVLGLCPPPVHGTEGCTPGYWKQKHHFDSWVHYSPGDKFNSAFGVSLFSSKTTLLDALKTGGGGKERLGRHATAALLNASNPDVDFGLEKSHVIALVKLGVAFRQYELVGNILEKMNERGCPLN